MPLNDDILKSDMMRMAFLATPISIARRKPLFGVCENNADYMVSPVVNGKKVICPAYKAWKGMAKRCYSSKFHSEHPTYKDVEICDEWLKFMTFRDWWAKNHVKGFELDKDILCLGSKVYSPDTCIYVPHWINSFNLDRGRSGDNDMIGAHFYKRYGNYQSYCKHPKSGKKIHLGYFESSELANAAWVNYKLEVAHSLKNEMDIISGMIYPAIVGKIKSMIGAKHESK